MLRKTQFSILEENRSHSKQVSDQVETLLITFIENYSCFFFPCISRWEKPQDFKGSQQTKALFPPLLPSSRDWFFTLSESTSDSWHRGRTSPTSDMRPQCLFLSLSVNESDVKGYTGQLKV